MADEWDWTIGQVVGAFGLAGEMKVRLETDFPERFDKLRQVQLRPEKGEPERLQVERSRPHKGQILLKVKGVERIEDVDRWRGAWVQVARETAVPLPRGSYYSSDLVGMQVVTVDGRDLGRVDAVLRYPAHDLLQVGEALVPAVPEMVRDVDVEIRRITVDLPRGLLPDDEPADAD